MCCKVLKYNILTVMCIAFMISTIILLTYEPDNIKMFKQLVLLLYLDITRHTRLWDFLQVSPCAANTQLISNMI